MAHLLELHHHCQRVNRKRASFFKGTLEQARLAGLTDEEIASIAAALKLVLEGRAGTVIES